MKRLPRNDDGSYDGAIAGEHALTAKEQRKVREVLSKGPMYVSTIADQCAIPRTHPARFDALCKFVDYLGQTTREAEMVFEPARAGQKFIGWKLTEHGKTLLNIS